MKFFKSYCRWFCIQGFVRDAVGLTALCGGLAVLDAFFTQTAPSLGLLFWPSLRSGLCWAVACSLQRYEREMRAVQPEYAKTAKRLWYAALFVSCLSVGALFAALRPV